MGSERKKVIYDIIWITRSPHFAHIVFAKFIHSKIIKLQKKLYKNILKSFLCLSESLKIPPATIYISEGTPPLYPIIISPNFNFTNSKLIWLACDSFLPSLFFNKTKRMLFKIIKEKVNGIIYVSKWLYEIGKSFGLDVPSSIVYPFIKSDVYQKLSKITPMLNSYNIVSIGLQPYKGIDILFKSFKIIKNEIKQARLYLIGKSEYPIRDVPEGVTITGFVPDLSIYFEKCSLYLQTSWGDAFSISVIEAMCAMIPPIVTEGVGAKEIVRKLSEKLVIQTDPEKVAKSVLNYWSLDLEEKIFLGKKARALSKSFQAKFQIPRFCNSFKYLIKEMD